MTPHSLRNQTHPYTGTAHPPTHDYRTSVEAMNAHIDVVTSRPRAARLDGLKEIFSALFNFTPDQQLNLIYRLINRTLHLNDEQFSVFSDLLIRHSADLNAEKNIDEVVDYTKQVSEWLLDAVIMRTGECIIDTCVRVSALGQHLPGVLDAFLVEQIMQALDQAPAYETGLVPAAVKMIWNLSVDHSLPYLQDLFNRLPDDTPSTIAERISALEAMVDVTDYLVPQPGSAAFTARLRETLSQARINAGQNALQ